MNKKALIKALLKDEDINKSSYVFSIEYIKVSEKIGFTKFGVYDANTEKVIFIFKIQVDPKAPENEKTFGALKDGEENLQVGLFQMESKSFLSKLKEGFTDSIGEGRIPFISGLFK